MRGFLSIPNHCEYDSTQSVLFVNPPALMRREKSYTQCPRLTSREFFEIFKKGGYPGEREVKVVATKPYYLQNDGKVSRTPPSYLGVLAKECWRRIVPFLEATGRVERVDTSLVEQYCTQYEIYRVAYEDIKENGIQTPMYKTLQDQMGEIIGKDFTGYKKNPAVMTLKDANNQLTMVGGQLGLSPKARQELMSIATKSDAKSATDALKEFL